MRALYTVVLTGLTVLGFLTALVYGIGGSGSGVAPPPMGEADRTELAERVAPIGTVRLQASDSTQTPAAGPLATSSGSETPAR